MFWPKTCPMLCTMRNSRRPFIPPLTLNQGQRLLASFGFNNIGKLVRIAVLTPLVAALLISGLLAQAMTLAVAFLVSFAFTSRVLYPARPSAHALGPVPATHTTPTGVGTA